MGRCRVLALWAALAALLVIAFFTDRVVMDAVGPLAGSRLGESIGHTVRWLGTGHVQLGGLLILIIVGALLHLRALRVGAWALLSFALSTALAVILKVLVHRPRPWTDTSVVGWNEYLRNSELHSFPSGESTTTFALAVVLAWWYPRWRGPLLTVAAIVAAARVLTGSHFPSDVCAGAMLGIAAGQLVTHLAGKSRQQGSPAQT